MTDIREAQESTAEEPSARESPADAESEAPERKTRWVRSARRWAAVVVLAAVLAGAGYAGWLLWRQHQADVAATQALDAARAYAVTLTSADPTTVDQNFAAIIDGATGEFKDKYSGASAQLRKVLLDNNVTTRGEVVDSAVKSATTGNVEVLLFVKQSVSNSAAPEPRTDLTAIAITMTKVDGQWLASKVVLPGEAS